VESGVAERATEERAHPGRPRTLYTARSDTVRVGTRSYRLLAEILTSYLAAETPRPAEAATRAGKAWGHYLADRPPPFRRIDAEAATRQLVTTLATLAFSRRPSPPGGEHALHQAEMHGADDLAVFLRGFRGTGNDAPGSVVAELDAPIETERLEPFVEPNLCIADLRTGKTKAGTNDAADDVGYSSSRCSSSTRCCIACRSSGNRSASIRARCGSSKSFSLSI